MTTAVSLKHSEAYFYALGRKHSGDRIDPIIFAQAYYAALHSWEESDNPAVKWVGIPTFYDRWVRANKRAQRTASEKLLINSLAFARDLLEEYREKEPEDLESFFDSFYDRYKATYMKFTTIVGRT